MSVSAVRNPSSLSGSIGVNASGMRASSSPSCSISSSDRLTLLILFGLFVAFSDGIIILQRGVGHDLRRAVDGFVDTDRIVHAVNALQKFFGFGA